MQQITKLVDWKFNWRISSIDSEVGAEPQQKRLSITPRVIQSATTTFLFAQGKENRMLAKALEQPDDIASLPVQKVICSTCFLDSDAYSLLK